MIGLTGVGSEKKVLLWGGKTKARIVQEMLRESKIGIATLIFDGNLEKPAFDSPALFINDILRLKEELASVSHYVVCMGGEHGLARYKTAKALEAAGLLPLTLKHDRGFVEASSTLGSGCQVMPGAVVHKFTSVGEQSIINTNATLEHDCVVGNGVHIMGNVATGGGLRIGDYVTIGTNATILPFLEIGEGAFIGAGAVVTKNVDPYTVVVGVPAKPTRKHQPIFHKGPLEELLR